MESEIILSVLALATGIQLLIKRDIVRIDGKLTDLCTRLRRVEHKVKRVE